jgi:diacylglycerol kinase family enzyme
MDVVLVSNQKSGSALSDKELKRKLRVAGCTVTRTFKVGPYITRTLKRYVQAHPAAIVVAIGGDGTISAVAGVLARTNAVLAPLPGGTLNHFTKDLGIPQDIDEAIAAMVRGTVRQIDIASVNDTYFVNNSSIGLYPSSLKSRERFENRLGKWPAAVIASIRSLVRFRTYRLTIDGTLVATPFVFVGNNVYKLDAAGVTERTRLNEGRLSVFVAKTTSRLQLAKIVLFALMGKVRHLNEFDAFTENTLTIEAPGSLQVSRDGEVGRISPPLTYQIHRRALRVRY